MLGAAEEVALFLAADAARGGDPAQRRHDLGDIVLDQRLGAEARLGIEAFVPHAVDIAVDTLVEDEEQPLDVARRRQRAEPFEPCPNGLIVEMLALVGIAPRLHPRLPVMLARGLRPGGIVGRGHEIAVGAERRGEKHLVVLRTVIS